MRAARISKLTVGLAAALTAVGGAVIGLAPAADAALPPGCVNNSPGLITCTYTSATTFTVPNGITSLTVRAVGGSGASITGPRSRGADLTAQLDTGPGVVYTVSPAGNGSASGSGGAGGGGAGGASSSCVAGGGGGASTLRNGSTLLLAAGGGGGQGCGPGVAGFSGGDAGQKGQNGSSGSGGGAGSNSLPGSGGSAAAGCPNGNPGSATVGGAGSVCVTAGGGGGGGVYPGGGGVGGPNSAFTPLPGTGGGGGANFVAVGVTLSTSGLDSTASPRIVISYSLGTATVSASSVDFGAIGTGLRSAPKSITLTAQNGPVVVSAVGIDGAGSADFEGVSNDCTGTTLAAGESCTVQVAFKPSATTDRSATLEFVTNAINGDVTVALSGKGHARPGALQIHGPGSVFTGSDRMVSRAVAPAAAAAYSIKVVNKSAAQAQYIVKVSSASGTPATVDLLVGSLSVKTLALGPDGYTTPPLAANATHALSLKVTPNAGSPQGISKVTVSLYAADRAEIDREYTETNVKAPTKGTSAYDLFAKNGSQANIGGSFSGQATTATTITATGSAPFVVRLQNDSASAAQIGFVVISDACGGAFPLTVKDGSVDVTAAAKAGTYVTPSLAAGTGRNLTITVKYTNNGSGCTGAEWKAVSMAGQTGAQQYFSYLNTNLA